MCVGGWLSHNGPSRTFVAFSRLNHELGEFAKPDGEQLVDHCALEQAVDERRVRQNEQGRGAHSGSVPCVAR